MAICRKLVELMGGSIGINSTLGKGSTFWFNLPFSKQMILKCESSGIKVIPAVTFANGSHTASSSPALNNVRILLAEDNKINQLVGVKQLKKIGYHNVDVANNGMEAVEVWKNLKHTIILMDCQMPEMDGYEAAKKIRALEIEQSMPHTQIIALTASVMLGDRELCLAAGMDDYISKPVIEGDLKNVLNKATQPIV